MMELEHPNIVKGFNLFETQPKGAMIKNWAGVIENVQGGHIMNTI
jgi:hypothetical protein